MFRWRPYVSVEQRQQKAKNKMNKLRKKGKVIYPIEIQKRTIATKFWGKLWCQHLESFSDYDNRLPRGRTYVRNGSVCHLEIKKGSIEAIVSGSDLYNVNIKIKELKSSLWSKIKKQCLNQVGSLLELLKGELSDHIMRIISDQHTGLFPKMNEITLSCDCPDWANMCKHVAAVLYGIGARLDTQPDLLFLLRNVDVNELINTDLSFSKEKAENELLSENISDIFGIELDESKATVAKKQKTIQEKMIKQKNRKKIEVKNISGSGLKKLRHKLSLRVQEFSKKLTVSASSVYRWERTKGKLKLNKRSKKIRKKILKNI